MTMNTISKSQEHEQYFKKVTKIYVNRESHENKQNLKVMKTNKKTGKVMKMKTISKSQEHDHNLKKS